MKDDRNGFYSYNLVFTSSCPPSGHERCLCVQDRLSLLSCLRSTDPVAVVATPGVLVAVALHDGGIIVLTRPNGNYSDLVIWTFRGRVYDVVSPLLMNNERDERFLYGFVLSSSFQITVHFAFFSPFSSLAVPFLLFVVSFWFGLGLSSRGCFFL